MKRRLRLLRLLILAGLLALQWASVPVVTTAAPAPAEDIPADWWAQVQEDIRQSEYHITWQEHSALPGLDAAYQAPNRAQNLRFYFTGDGIRVIPRTGDAAWELGMSVRDAGPAELVAQARRIAYQRAAFAETFANTEAGLQHAVALGDATAFDLVLNGNLTPHIAAGGASVEFRTAAGVPVLRYGDFSAVDNAGKNVPVQLSQPGATHLRFTFPVSRFPHPASPLTFHALLTALPNTADWNVESNQADAQLGFAVAGAGDINGDGFSDVLVGAPTYDGGADNEGRVYAYYGAAGGLSAGAAWTQEIDLASAQFGAAVASAGDVNGDGYADVIIGAPNYANGQTQEGAAFVYHGSASGLSAAANWQYESDKAGAHFGAAVSNAGYAHSSDYTGVLIGAPEFNETLANQGKAFVFYGNTSGLNFAPDWSNAGDQTSARFGASVSCAGDVDSDGYQDILIGAPGYDDNTTPDAGAAFIYHGSAGGIGAVPGWQVLGNSANAKLGASVSLAGDVNGNGYGDVIVGAPGTNSNAGAAYVYLGASAGLTTTVGWSITGAISNTQLGADVALAGDVDGDGYADVLVGAPGFTDGETGEGEAQLYSGSASGLSAAATWTHSPNQAGAHFGAAVAGAGDVNGDGFGDVLIGAPGYSHPESNEGGAFAFYGGADAPNQTADWNVTGSGEFGYAVASAGDVNGDGYADVIVGAHLYDTALSNAGQILIYLGSANGLATTAITTRDGEAANAQLGYSVSTAGDVDGDGYDDIIAGAPYHTNGQDSEGRAYVYFGSAGGLEPSPDWYAESNMADGRLGRSVACAGDVNGDGYSDIIVGAPYYSSDSGRAFIWRGKLQVGIGMGDGTPSNAYWTGNIGQNFAIFGSAVSSAGDVNGDGYSDVIVGARSYNNGQTLEGAAFLYLGGAGAMDAAPVWQTESNQANARYGTTASAAGDVNGDGFSDFLVGAPEFDNGQTNEGAVFLFYGTDETISIVPDLVLELNQANAEFGTSVSGAGDVNGDGYADVIIGTPLYKDGGSTYGGAFIYYGSGAGLSAVPDWSVHPAQTSTGFGGAISAAGDVNGDGFNDVIVSTRHTYINVFHGNGGGMTLRPRQLQPTGAAYLTPLGRTNSPDSVRVHLNGKTPLGYDRLKLEWQVTPLGQPFGGPGTTSGASDAWTASGATFAQTITGLASSTAYHWRVRLRYRAGNPLNRPTSRWIHMPWSGWLETDFQTAPGALSVSATNDSPTALGSATTLTATANATYVTYAWDFGDSATGSGKVVTHTYAAAGTYTATVTAGNGVSTAVASTYVFVGDEPIAGLALANDSPTAAGQATHFTATVTAGGGITYTWDFDDGSPLFVSDADNTVEHVYTTPGNYVATVTARNLFGAVSATSPVTITDAPVTGLSAANDSPTTLGQPTAFTATITGGGNVSYAWAFGDGTSGSGANATHTYGAVGTYTAIVTASNGVNSLTATTPVAITDVPATGLSATNDSPTALGQPTAFAATVTGGSNVSYAWDFGDSQTGSGANPTHTYAAGGVYLATVTASNGTNALQATTCVTVETPISGLQAANDSPVPVGQPVDFAATVAGGDNVAYTWSFGDGATGSGANLSHAYVEQGFYTAIVTATNQVSQLSASTRVTITEVPLAGLAAVNDSPTPLDDATTFTATVAAGSGAVYTWAFGDGATGSGAVVQHVYPAVGDYTATVTATNSVNSLTVSTQVTITGGTPVSGVLAFNDGPTVLGSATTLSATVESGSGVTYTWAFGDGASFIPQTWPDSGKVVTHTYPAVGTYTATVTATNRAGQTSATTAVLVVDAPIAGLAAHNDSPTGLGAATTLSATITSGSNVVFTWELGDGQTASGALVTHVYPDIGIFTATVTATNALGAFAASTTVTITAAPVVEVIYVDEDATGPLHNGLSWTIAYTNVQAALDWTNAHGAADYEIWVAEGIYYPDEGVGHHNNVVTESFRIAWNNVQLYGGFTGDETAREQRNWTLHPTVLSADIDGNDRNTDANAIAETWNDLLGNNAYHVLWLDGATNEPITEMTVLDGFIVTAGNANGGERDGYGGGLYCEGSGAGSECSPTLNNVTFSGNIASTYGGGMYNSGREEGKSNPRLTHVTFSGNTSIGGGGMFNSASYNGESSPTLLNVTFRGNQAEYSCGGMSNSARGSTTVPNTGGVSSPTLTNVVFSGNRARRGGAMGNDGDWGGYSAPTLINVTFSGNAASEEGGGILNTQFQGFCHPTLVNSILWGNTAPLGSQIHNHNSTVTTILYTDIQGGAAGEGNLNVDPQFVTPITATAAPTVKGNYHLRATSPVINAGHTLSVTATTDRGGNPRVVDDVVDMGAYESQSVNTAPTLSIPNISMGINTTRALDLRDYADDNEDPTTVLTFTVASISTGDFAATLAGDGHTLNLTPATNWTGTVTVTIQVTDPGQLSASDAFNVQVSSLKHSIYLPMALRAWSPLP